MEPFRTLSGVAAPLLRPNIDTDAIIPSREMKRVSKTGLAEGLFANWRYVDVAARTEDEGFILNQPPYRHAPILVAGANFGCGSSREHAVWALAEYGIRCVLAPSFGAIFKANCARNGVLAVVLPDEAISAIAEAAGPRDGPARVLVDLEAREVRLEDGRHWTFAIDPGEREMLLQGLDAIGLTLMRAPAIADFEARYHAVHPWRRIDLARRLAPETRS